MPPKKQPAKSRTNTKATTKRPGPARRRSAVARQPDQGTASSTAPATHSPDSAAHKEKYVVLNLERDPDLDYYVKTSGPGGREGGDVWAVRRAEPGTPKPKPIRITSVGFHIDWDKFNYFVDEDGDVSRKPRRWNRKARE